ncbi:maestro heat-like repeat-containing protein family member 6 [Geothlypis trichas]
MEHKRGWDKLLCAHTQHYAMGLLARQTQAWQADSLASSKSSDGIKREGLKLPQHNSLKNWSSSSHLRMPLSSGCARSLPGAALDKTQEQEPGRGRVRKTLKVPAIVRNIHHSLQSNVALDARLQIAIVRLAEEHPADVVLTLLRCAPTCDRYAAMIWRTIGSSGPAVEKVLATLLCVMEDWPVHSACTSDGDDRDVFALTATLVIWVIVQVPECHEAMILYSSRLFVAMLFHVVITTRQMPPVEAGNFWRACQEEHRLPSSYNRFAVQAMKALLCRLRCDNEVVAMERKRGWDTLLCAHTQHYAMGLLAR